MKTITMDTILGTTPVALSVEQIASRHLEPIATCGNEKFILTDEAYLDNDNYGNAAYFAHAVKLGDEIEDGEAKLYLVQFEITNPETEDASEACDWSVVQDYSVSDTIDVVA